MLLRGENIPRSCYLPWGYHKIFKVLLFYFEKMKMPLFIQRISWLTFRFLYVFLGCCIRLATECPRRRFGVSIVLERTFVANGQLQCPVSRSANFFTPANLVTELWNATHHLYSRCSFADDRYWPSHSYEVILQHLPENCRKKACKALATEAEHKCNGPLHNDLRGFLMLFCWRIWANIKRQFVLTDQFGRDLQFAGLKPGIWGH